MNLIEWCKENNKEYLLDEWSYKKNGGLKPEAVTYGSNKKVWWICKKCRYEWEKKVVNRTILLRNCPVCANKKVLRGYNDLATTNPQIAKEWNHAKNKDLTPMDIVAGSHKIAWWICDKGHEYLASVHLRTIKNKPTGCPICVGKKVLVDYNDFESQNPELAKQWHPTKNGVLNPRKITAGSNKKVWWVCKKCGYEWEATIANRNKSNGTNCPCCAGQKVVQGINDLEAINPELAKEWHPTKNGELLPSDVTSGSDRRVWWICKKGHEWEASIGNRYRLGVGCPNCAEEMRTSFPEQMLYFYLKKAVNVEVENRAIVFGKEIDVYIPSWKIGIEYDGSRYHNTKESKQKEEKKDEYFRQKNITIIHIKESDMNKVDYENKTISCIVNSGYRYMKCVFKHLSNIIFRITEFQICFDIHIDRDSAAILEQYIKNEKANSLAVRNPEVAKSWNYNKNKITADMVSCSSNKKMWWKCTECGSEWQATINHRNRYQTSCCPTCSMKKKWEKRIVELISKNGSLSDSNPELAKEWHPTKNGELLPSDVTSGSDRRVWWICKKGHEWKATVGDRNRGTKCPICCS